MAVADDGRVTRGVDRRGTAPSARRACRQADLRSVDLGLVDQGTDPAEVVDAGGVVHGAGLHPE